MKNKTIFDAVNELKGSLSNGSGGYYADDTYLFHALDGSHYITDDNRGDEGVYQYISTTKEFNALVEEMELGLDVNEINHRTLHAYICNPKELLKPEPIKQASSTYTQEMADNGVFPSVGMECLVSNRKVDSSTFEKATILFIGKFVVLYNSESCTERVGDMDSTGYITFKPLTPPTPLIDGKAYQFDSITSDAVSAIYFSVDNRFYVGEEYYNTQNCTNIQPLTVEGK